MKGFELVEEWERIMRRSSKEWDYYGGAEKAEAWLENISHLNPCAREDYICQSLGCMRRELGAVIDNALTESKID